MLSPVSLRICWVAAMAPALTEAATQANSFTLPNSPALESFSPIRIGSLRKQSKLSDISQSFVTLSQIGANSETFPHLTKKLNTDGASDLALLPWNDIKQNLKIHQNSTNGKLGNLCDTEKGTNKLHIPCRLESIIPLHGLKDQCQSSPCKQMMNENPNRLRDTMGLLNTNTSLDCELKGKLVDGSDLSELEQKPYLLTPEDTRPYDMDSKPSPISDMCRSASDYSVLLNEQISLKPEYIPVENEKPISELEISGRNVHLQRKAVYLITRLRRLQARQTETHIRGQLKDFVEHQQQNLGIPCLQQKNSLNNLNKIQNSEELLHSEDVKNLSTAALVSLVRKLESSQHGKYSHLLDLQDQEKVEVKMSPAECQSIKSTTRQLCGSVTYLEKEMDSDATESNSSDESGLEDDHLPQRMAPHSPSRRSSHKHASWRWAVDRAAVASRWIWLQTQVSDLEYRIRQQTDVYKHLRSHKGNVVLSDKFSTRPVDDRLAAGDNNRNFGTKVVNGFKSSENINAGLSSSEKGEELRSDQDCSRTRPLKMFRKRKLARTMGLHLMSRKAARLSSVKCTCNCQRELLPCIICSGRYNSVQTLDSDNMPVAERISLLDSAFHPVLSFKHEACLGIRYEKMLRKCEFSKSAEKQGLVFKKRRYAISLAHQARRHTRKLTKNAAVLLSSAKLRKSLGSRHHRFSRLNRKDSNHQRSGSSDSYMTSARRGSERVRTCSISSNGSSKPPSPAPSPVPSNTGDAVEVQEQHPYKSQNSSKVGSLHDLIRRRRLDNAFDINNIVIPHSIASATRVEKLQYKEILTPKWRVLEENDRFSPEDVNLEEIEGQAYAVEVTNQNGIKLEDLSEDTFIIRHLRCEEDEKKKFLSYVTKSGKHGRSRLRSGRGDNRADSSGANTPDPMSPYPADSSSNQEAPSGWNSPVASPPPTPSPFLTQDEHYIQGKPALIGRERRRTLSFSKRVSEEDHLFFVEDYFAVPYEPRTFPLAEDEYLEMLKDSPHLEEAIQSEATSLASDETGVSFSRPQSPGNSSSIGSMPEEDPNDPEWTVMTGGRNRKPSIILKLAKR